MANNGKPLGSMIIGLSMDGTQFSNTMDGIKRQIKTAQSAMKANLSVLGNAGDEYATLESKISGLNQVMQANQKQIELLRKKHKDAIGTYGEGSKEASNYANQINNAVIKQAAWEKQLKLSQGKLVDVKNSTADLQKEIDTVKNATKENTESLEKSGKVYSAQKSKVEGLSKSVRLHSKLVDSQDQKVKELTSALGENDEKTKEAAREYAKLVSVQKDMESELSGLTRKFNTFTPKMSAASDHLGTLSSKMQKLGDRARDTGSQISGVGRDMATTFGTMAATVGAGLGFSVKKAMDFEATMSGVKSVMDPEDVKKYDSQLEDLAITLGADTKYSATEAAKGMEELIKAGVNTEEIMNGGLKGALSLATAGELELADAAEIASTALNAFKDDNLSVGKAADILAGAANASATDVGELKFGLSAVSAVASGVGLNFEETSTALALFAQNGLKGSDAGTSLKTMLLNLSPSTKAQREQFDELGLSAYNVSAGYKYLVDKGITPAERSVKGIQDGLQKLAKQEAGSAASKSDVTKAYNSVTDASGLMSSAFYDEEGSLKSMSEIAGRLRESMQGLNEEQRQNALRTMFGSDAIRAGNILYKEGAKGIDNMNEAMSKIKADDVAAQKLNNFKGALEELSGSTDTAAISIGQALIPALTSIVKTTQKVVDKFNGLSERTKNFIAISGAIILAVTAIAAGMGLLVMAIGGVMNGIGTIALAGSKIISVFAKIGGVAGIVQKALLFITGPIGLTIAAIAGLGIAFFLAYKKIQPFHDFINKLGSRLKSAVMPAVEAVTSFIQEKISSLKKFWDQNGPMFIQALKNVFSVIVVIIKAAMVIIVPIIKIAFFLIQKIIASVWKNIEGIIDGALNICMGLVKIFSGLFTGNFSKMWEGIRQVFFGAIKLIWNWVQLMWFGKLLKGAGLFVKSFKSFFVGMFKSLKDTFTSSIKWIVKSVQSLHKSVTGGLSKMKDGALKMFNGLKDGALKIFDKMLKNVKDLPGKMGDALKKGAKNVASGAKVVSKYLLEGLAKGVNGVRDGVNFILDKVHAPKKARIPKWNIPEYAKGTNNHPGGFGIVGEAKKHELIKTPDGQIAMSPNKATLLNMPKGTKILGGDKTQSLFRQMGIPKYAKGNWAGEAKDFIADKSKKVVTKGLDLGKDIYEFATNPKELINAAIGKFTDFSQVLDPSLSIVKGMVSKVKDGAVDWIKGMLDGGDVKSSGNPTADVKRWVTSGMNIAGVTGSNWFKGLSLIAMKESGGNPTIQNNWDSNAAAGIPSAGLMQMIRPTFEAHKKSGYGNWLNPIHQVISAIGYIKSRYKTIGNVPGVKAVNQGRKYVGYANGTDNAAPGWARVNEKGGEMIRFNGGETVIPHDATIKALTNVFSNGILNGLKSLPLMQSLARYVENKPSNKGQNSSVNTANSGSIIDRQDKQLALMQQQIDLLTKILLKENNTIIDGKTIYDVNKKYSNSKTKIRNIAKGVTSL